LVDYEFGALNVELEGVESGFDRWVELVQEFLAFSQRIWNKISQGYRIK
jgi:hypothetical protein